jgi:hypothetical protein
MMTQEKQTVATFNGDAIPQILKEQKRWSPWRAVWNEKRAKFDKIPMRADSPTYGISTAKPEQWFTYGEALAAYQRNPDALAGVGYVMTGPHGFVGTDLDNCIKNGVVEPWAQAVVDALASYTEISPSGKGLRIFSTGELPDDWNNHEVGIEIYGGNEARFLTVTGQHLAETPSDITPAPAGVLPTLATQYAKERRKADVIDLNMPTLVDDMLLPSISNIDLPDPARDFLLDGSHRGDRSRELFATAVALYASGLADDEVFSILAYNDNAMEIALDHRRQDNDRALLYLWREHCCKGKAKAAASRSLSIDDFDDISEPGIQITPTLKEISAPRFTVQTADAFAQRTKMSWLIKGILPQAGLCVIYGDSGSGKTFFTLDLAGAVARGTPWRGKKVKKGRVVMVCAEGAGGFRNRLDAFAQHNGIDLADFDLGVIADAPNLLEKTDVKDLLAALHTFGKVDMIIIDTLAQTMPGGNENSGDDMGRVLAHCKAIHKHTGALVTLVHHSGKDASRGARGWSGLRGAADAQIEIVRAGDDRAAIVDKQKDGAGEGDEFGFKLNIVTIGEDEDGEAVTSCTLEHTDAVPRSERKKEPKGANEKIVLRVAQDLLDLAGELHTSELVNAAVNQLPFDESSGKRDRREFVVLRAIEALVASSRLSTAGGRVALC